MFHVSTAVAESFPTTTRITKTSFLLNVQRYYSTHPGTRQNLSHPIFFINFLTVLKRYRPADVATAIESSDIRTPTVRELAIEMGEHIKKNPYGMINMALKLRDKIPRNRGTQVKLSSNEVRRRCLQELYQRARVGIGLPRDISNAKYYSAALWRTFIQASNEQRMRLWKELDEELLEKRSDNLKKKAIRHIRRRRDLLRRRSPRTKAPSWLNPGLFSEAKIECKLKALARRLRRRIGESRLRQVAAAIAGHAREKEKAAALDNESTLNVSTWNVDKNSDTIPKCARNLEVGIIPDDVDVLCVVEAQKFTPGSKRRSGTKFRQCSWTSSTIGATQVLVRYPHILAAEIDVGSFPPSLAPLHEESEYIRDSAEITVCKIQDGRGVRQLATPNTQGNDSLAGEFFVCSVYLPPCPSLQRFKDMVTHVTKICGNLLDQESLPIVLAGDFNIDLLQGLPTSRSREVAARKRTIWNSTWAPFLMEYAAKMNLLHGTSQPSFNPTSESFNASLLDAVYLISGENSTAKPLPSAGFFTTHIPTQHAIVSGVFSLSRIPTGFSSGKLDAGEKTSERVKWDKLRYDVEKQDELRISLQAELRALNEVTVENFGDTITKAAAKILGSVPTRSSNVTQRNTARSGTRFRQGQPWNSRRLDLKAKEVTLIRRRLEAVGKKIRNADCKLQQLPRFQLYSLHQNLGQLRFNLRNLIREFDIEIKATKQRYFDEANSHLRTDSMTMISQSHTIRRRVLQMRQPKSRITHDAATMNEEWQKIFDGDGSLPPNDDWLKSLTSDILQEAEDESTRITVPVDRVREALRRLKNGKATGVDGVANEGLKLIADMDEEIVAKISSLFENIINCSGKGEGAIDVTGWKAGLLALIPKEIDNDNAARKPSDYRPISLLSHLAKLLELVTAMTLEEECGLDAKLAEQQFGFRKRSGTTDAQINLRSLHEICVNRGLPLLVALLDIKKAFDTVPFDVVAAALARLRVHPRLIRFLRNWIDGQTRHILIDGNSSEAWLNVRRGVPQGSSLSPVLFAAVMDTLDGYLKGESVLGAVGINPAAPRLEVSSWVSQMYADDTVIFAHCIDNMNKNLEHVREWSRFAGLSCHPSKFELLRLGALSIRSPSGRVLSTSSLHVPKNYTVSTVGVDKIYRWNQIRRIGENKTSEIRFGSVVIPLSANAKYLGIDIRGWKYSGRGGITPADFFSRVEHRLKPTRANIDATKFAFRVGEGSCSVQFAAALLRPLAEGLYFGVESSVLKASHMKNLRTVIGIAAKAGLGIHKSASTSSAFKFLGWQEPRVVIALRRLNLLRRKAIFRPAINGEPEGDYLDPPAMLIAEGATRNEFSAFWLELRHSLSSLIGPEAVEKHFPDCGIIWKRNMLADRVRNLGRVQLSENISSARADINALIDAVKKCEAYNHQHPIVRVAREHAFAAFKFTCYSLIPFRRQDQQPAPGPPDKCQLCGEEGIPTGFHLLTTCSHRRCRAIMAGILSDEDIEAWKAGRESYDADYSRINAIIERDNPSLRAADDKVKAMILVHDPNNDLDVLARLLIRELRDSSTSSGNRKWRRNEVVRRGGGVELYRINGLGGKWSSSNAEKELLYTAYRWVAKLCFQLWRVRSDAYRFNRANAAAAEH